MLIHVPTHIQSLLFQLRSLIAMKLLSDAMDQQTMVANQYTQLCTFCNNHLEVAQWLIKKTELHITHYMGFLIRLRYQNYYIYFEVYAERMLKECVCVCVCVCEGVGELEHLREFLFCLFNPGICPGRDVLSQCVSVSHHHLCCLPHLTYTLETVLFSKLFSRLFHAVFTDFWHH